MSDEQAFVEDMTNDHVYRIGDDLKDVGERIMYMNMYADCTADRLQRIVAASIQETTKALEQLKAAQEKINDWIQAKGRSDRE